MRRWILGIMGLTLSLGLAGCSRNQLTTTKTTYHATGLVAVVKGTSQAGQVTYQIDHQARQRTTVHDHTFIIQVPSQPRDQRIHLTVGNTHKTVRVAASKALVEYQKMQAQVNQGLIGSHLSATNQKKALAMSQLVLKLKQQPQNRQLMMQLGSLQAAVAPAMAQAKRAAKDQLLPVKTPASGLHTLVATADFQTRLNVQQGQVMAVAMMIPTKVFKTKAGQKAFGTSFALLAQASGASAKTVFNGLKTQAKAVKNGKTTTDPIYSHGVTFKLGLSPDKLFLFMTK